MAVSFGVMMLQRRPAAELVGWARRFDEAGVDSVWVADHTAWSVEPDTTWYDGWSLLAAMATQTERIRIGPLVSQFVMHTPLHVARLAVTVDELSDGRLNLGLGGGGAPIELSVAGLGDADVAQLTERFERGIRDVCALLAGDAVALPPTSGLYGRTAPPTISLPPVQQRPIPIVVGGDSAPVVDIAARYADRWNALGRVRSGQSLDEVLRRKLGRLHELAATHGREPAAVTASLLLDFSEQSRPRTAAELADTVAWAHDLGFAEVIAYAWLDSLQRSPDELLTFAADHLPQLRE